MTGAHKKEYSMILHKKYLSGLFGTILSAGIFVSAVADACTRAVYIGTNDQIVTARSMDWKVDVGTNLWVFPRGMERNGATGENTIKWTSKYGSVIASGYDISTTDGMNEKGLVANVLWLVESEYPTEDNGKPGLSIAAWAQYVLDNYATVDEAVKALAAEPFQLITDTVPGEDRLATLHLSLSDATGDSAIIEYLDGKQVINHSRSYNVMTNSPAFDKQLALDSYWKEVGGTAVLPGTSRAADRFARASFYIDALPKSDDPVQTVAGAFSVIRNVSVPLGISTPDQPNISSTRWRTVSDQKHKRYFFESAMTPNIFWVDINKLDLDEKTGKVMKLDLGPDQRNIFSGEVNSNFKEAKPFEFLGVSK